MSPPDDQYPELRDVFGVEALDGTKRQNSKSRKKSRMERGGSVDPNGGSSKMDVGSAVSAMTGLKMKAKLRVMAKKRWTFTKMIILLKGISCKDDRLRYHCYGSK